MKNNPALCTASNFCAINCNAFFDGKTLPQDAGDFVAGWVKQVSEAAGGKTTIVTESGWPTQGDTNDLAMPSPENQALAMASLKKAFNGGTDIILFNSYVSSFLSLSRRHSLHRAPKECRFTKEAPTIHHSLDQSCRSSKPADFNPSTRTMLGKRTRRVPSTRKNTGE